jgi:hypothetical protein
MQGDFTAFNLASANGHTSLMRTYEAFEHQEQETELVEEEIEKEAETEMAHISQALGALMDSNGSTAALET